jgi:small neutral amino acid transporter SnatA (MarC family)
MKRLTLETVIIPTASPLLASPLVILTILALFNFSSDADVASYGFMCVCVEVPIRCPPIAR